MPADPPSDDVETLREKIAAANGFALYAQYEEPEAAAFIGVHPVTLKKTRLEGRIGFMRKGKRAVSYFGFQIADFLIESIQWREAPTPPSGSESPGLVAAPAAKRGTVIGTMPKPDARDVHRLALQALKKPRRD